MLDALHFITLLGGTEDLHKEVSRFIQTHLDSDHAFRYALKVIELQVQSDWFGPNIEFCYWIMKAIILAKVNKKYSIHQSFLPESFGRLNLNDFWMKSNELFYRHCPLPIDLNFFIETATRLTEEKRKYFEVQMKFFPCSVRKTKNLDGILSFYPCTFQLTSEDPSHPTLYGLREGENSEFLISSDKDNFTKYGQSHIATVSAGFWGTGFEIFDSGITFSKKER